MPQGKNFTITADSQPIIDGWGYDTYWGPNDWISWHKKMKEKFGLDEANHRFIEAYGEPDFGAASYDWRTFDDTFIEYAKENGFHNALFNGLGGLIGKVASLGKTAVSKTSDTASSVIENAGDTITSLSKMAKWVIPVIVILIIAGGIVYITKRKAII
jgi:hypothetical protein